ncbi:MAG: hypothetical protein JW820_01795 [Spirochaetales bacterium]|nr:hypothetical protein [Spirochaetales bacterium]
MTHFVMTVAAGLMGALFGLSYKLKERRGLATDPLLLLFGVLYVAVSGLLLLCFHEPLFSSSALWLGILSGAAMYGAVRAFYGLIARSQLNIAWLILQFSIAFPFVLSMAYYREKLELQGAAGVALMLASILFFGLSKRGVGKPAAIPDRRAVLLLVLSTALTGVSISVPRIYAAVDPQGGTFTLLIYQGLTVTLLAAVLLGVQRAAGRARVRGAAMLPLALYMTLTNSLSAASLVVATRGLAGAIVYPVRSAVNVLVVFVMSFLLFKERVRPLEAVGSAVALAGILLVAATLG